MPHPRAKPAFTVVELLVSLSIIIALTTVVIANYRGAARVGDLTMAAQKFMSDLRLMQGRALGMAVYAGDVPGGGWGLAVDYSGASSYATTNRRRYTFFADAYPVVSPNGIFTTATEQDGSLDGANDSMYIELPVNIYIASVEPAAASSRLNFIVQPPDPDITITNNTGAASYTDTATITLAVVGSTVTRQIVVNRLGMIDLAE